jgi:hypothetical protein
MNPIASLADPPLRPRNRIATRLIMEMQVDGAAAITRALGGNFDRAVIFLALLRETSEIRDHAKGTATAHGASRPGTSVNALAASLARPFETVRRHVNALIGDGLCLRDSGHIRGAHGVTIDDGIATALTHFHDIMIRLIEDMAEFGLPLPAQRTCTPHDERATIAAAIDLLLIAIEFHAAQHGDWLEVILYGAIMVANARPITYDLNHANSYSESDTVPPEALRLAISAPAVARAFGLPYSTVGRHVARMMSDGRLVRRPGGLIISAAWMSTPSQLGGARIVAERAAQIFARLAASGFTFDQAATLYRCGRPALLDFGPRYAIADRLTSPA